MSEDGLSKPSSERKLSKNQARKMARFERSQQIMKEKRIAERQRRSKLRKAGIKKPRISNSEFGEKLRISMLQNAPTVCVDFQFADLMSSKVAMSNEDVLNGNSKEKIIMLSPDADLPLENVENGHIYVLGGLVDETRQQGKTASLAKLKGLQCRRLPILEYMKKAETGTYNQILALNQEISGKIASAGFRIEPKSIRALLQCFQGKLLQQRTHSSFRNPRDSETTHRFLRSEILRVWLVFLSLLV
ncbi:unnamed protein product [Notodromas monacha]|uniref:SAM-dependent MTase TRM10-type domain-containing protein n=1 Tax=Notodromas monacha TaxID=399045 RepID=A0A7R9BIL4_9CRUS|nr:unnamed protein product [Notodromas monacha]CAG0914793.1 unnamed protein product [Notodromas monacha]